MTLEASPSPLEGTCEISMFTSGCCSEKASTTSASTSESEAQMPHTRTVSGSRSAPVGRFVQLTIEPPATVTVAPADRKSTRLNSSHVAISYAVFCLKKNNNKNLWYH